MKSGKWFKGSLIVLGSICLAVVALKASDKSMSPDTCPVGMVAISTSLTMTCMDIYEASPDTNCPDREVNALVDTNRNLLAASCAPESEAGVDPWRFVSREQAMNLCARAGKRLPTAKEWYEASMGLLTTDCHFSGGVAKAGSSACSSPAGVYDLAGNVWEWVSDDIINGQFNGRTLPISGYVAQVDSYGIATLGSSSPVMQFDSDYFWTEASGSYGMVRGGFFGSDLDGGIYSMQANVSPNFQSAGIGFRCVK